MTVRIALLDDQTYGLAQIHAALPAGCDYTVDHFYNLDQLTSQSAPAGFDILLLDYYLQHGVTGADIFTEVTPRAKLVIGFSSVSRCNEELLRTGVDYAVVKTAGTENSALTDLFLEIL